MMYLILFVRGYNKKGVIYYIEYENDNFLEHFFFTMCDNYYEIDECNFYSH